MPNFGGPYLKIGPYGLVETPLVGKLLTPTFDCCPKLRVFTLASSSCSRRCGGGWDGSHAWGGPCTHLAHLAHLAPHMGALEQAKWTHGITIHLACRPHGLTWQGGHATRGKHTWQTPPLWQTSICVAIPTLTRQGHVGVAWNVAQGKRNLLPFSKGAAAPRRITGWDPPKVLRLLLGL